MDRNFLLNVPVNLEDLANSLSTNSEISYEDMFKFVQEIDHLIADWDFTEMLYKYFKTEMKNAASERS